MLHSSGSVIYGSKDPLFGEEEHRQIMVNDQLQITVIPDADHAMEASGTCKSLDIISRIAKLYSDALKRKA
ncbi:hypothetical protein [Paenibacillus sp. OSY-SE]|uniref:hypothetical protein n=1 Tax=Paenibacillus sp. OSY-SE TaxID=1196323 RepID=UPI000315032C|nr:hypothetical protein [Paenibacillus sp. OSY-SE]